jgi:signal transduction histidine kinase
MATSRLHLTDRLVDRFMVFGLACVFLCVTTAVVLSWRQSLTEFMAATVSLPLVSLLVGGIALRRTVRFSSLIEDQLCDVANEGDLNTGVSLVAATDDAARGWNRIVERLQDQHISASLEARLSESLGNAEQKRWSAVFNLLSDGIAVCDQQLTIVQANNAVAALLRANDPASLVGRKLGEVLQDICVPSVAERVRALTAGSGRVHADIQLGEDLSAGVLRLSRTGLNCEECGPGATLWTVRDVTQQRLAEEMRNQFLSTATHELRTPLTTIMSYAELLAHEDQLDLVKQKSFINVINAEASRLSRFVDQMLNVTQLEAGALALSRHETDIERMVHEIVENVQPQALQKQVTFDSQFPPKIPKLSVDKDKLAASLVNLLGNAIKYTPSGGRVKLSVEVAADRLHFHVEDTGIGIAADELPRIAEKFFRSQDARVREITGTGLGLAFAQEVARLHGGVLAVASELNKGSRFTLSLPLGN